VSIVFPSESNLYLVHSFYLNYKVENSLFGEIIFYLEEGSELTFLDSLR